MILQLCLIQIFVSMTRSRFENVRISSTRNDASLQFFFFFIHIFIRGLLRSVHVLCLNFPHSIKSFFGKNQLYNVSKHTVNRKDE